MIEFSEIIRQAGQIQIPQLAAAHDPMNVFEVIVEKGSTRSSSLHQVDDSKQTFLELFRSVATASPEGFTVSGSKTNGPYAWSDIPPSYQVLATCSRFQFISIKFRIPTESTQGRVDIDISRSCGDNGGEKSSKNSGPNIFQVMMASRSNQFAIERVEVRNNKDVMHNSLADHMEAVNQNPQARSLHRALLDALWYLDCQRSKLAQYRVKIPSILEKIAVNSLNDPKKSKHPIPNMNLQALEEFAFRLRCFVEAPWLKLDLQVGVLNLLQVLVNLVHRLKEQNVVSKRNHAEPSPVRSIFSDGAAAVYRFPKGLPPFNQEIQKLIQVPYEVLALENVKSFSNSKEKTNFIQNIKVPFPIVVFRYYFGNYLGSLCFVWRTEETLLKDFIAMHSIQQGIPAYHTREMRKAFTQRFSGIARNSPAIMLGMYRFLTQDNSKASTDLSEAVQQRLAFVLDHCDDHLIYDLRTENFRTEQFDKFFDAAEGTPLSPLLTLTGSALMIFSASLYQQVQLASRGSTPQRRKRIPANCNLFKRLQATRPGRKPRIETWPDPAMDCIAVLASE